MRNCVLKIRHLLLFFVLLTFSCEMQINHESDASNYFNLNKVGDFHNYALEKIITNCPESPIISSISGAQTIRAEYLLSLNNYREINKDFKLKSGKLTEDEILFFASKDFQKQCSFLVAENLDLLLKKSLINFKEKEFLTQIYDNCNSIDELNIITQIITNLRYSSNFSKQYIKSVHNLARGSAQFWLNNNSLITNGNLRTPIHVDVGGVIVGCAIAAFRQESLEVEDIPEIMAAGIMTGVVASSGIAGRIGRWLFK
ncbi:MAG TPA: hypothetical protein PKD85_05660 [Saprospiraceae bacterium]|nr:hypothetical protein [Saprospiraceae bacterium]